jgi:hypothetical protein
MKSYLKKNQRSNTRASLLVDCADDISFYQLKLLVPRQLDVVRLELVRPVGTKSYKFFRPASLLYARHVLALILVRQHKDFSLETCRTAAATKLCCDLACILKVFDFEDDSPPDTPASAHAELFEFLDYLIVAVSDKAA